VARSRPGCLCGGVGTGSAPRSTRGQRGRKPENPVSSILNGRNAWVEGAATQERQRQEKIGSYRESQLKALSLQPNGERLTICMRKIWPLLIWAQKGRASC
jgi:hypothetical protein